MQLLRSTWVEVNLELIKYNFIEIKKYIGKNVKVGAVLKANAYGHGAIEIAKVLENEVDYLCVAGLNEALELRNEKIETPILVMGSIPDNYLKLAIEKNISITIYSYNQVIILNDIANELKKKAIIHIKIDTGFNRLGFKIEKDIVSVIKEIYNMDNIYVEGIFSHLALKDKDSDQLQYEKFKNLINLIYEENIKIPIKHISDSIGMVAYNNFSMDMVRVGASIYGYNSRKSSLDLKAAMTFKSKLIQVKEIKKGEGVSYDYSFIAPKDMILGTIPCGYSDGIPRTLSNKGFVNIDGKRANIVGKMCMDQCMVDLSNIKNAQEGMEVIFYGEGGPDLLEVANLAETNRNEILAMVSRRVARVYYENSELKNVVDYLV
ncbi:alanine racemase [Romboutsia weinsteinii]|uniref:Alanine racemase n=1 Tax=Romboutsia weinsteinii TaxID=2020949 RepID=A0A371IYV1_9FIRM|nr:alanine racemase [Romboutsia weinsteinii]RDY25663.1 alanine racemase [Romboutsia weinsteinii]